MQLLCISCKLFVYTYSVGTLCILFEYLDRICIPVYSGAHLIHLMLLNLSNPTMKLWIFSVYQE